MTDAATRPLPLDGIRVVEFCQTIMGPSAGLILADLGADVIKVEPAPDGDKTRRLHGFAAGFFGRSGTIEVPPKQRRSGGGDADGNKNGHSFSHASLLF